jgi:hypothetical protein
MAKSICGAVVAAALATFTAGLAFAAPPASCASKFVGTWAYQGGVTEVRADGTAYPKCPMCVPMQTWTCSGNTYFFQGPGSHTATLSPDGQQLIGAVVATRVGGRVVTPKLRKPSVGTTEPATTAPTVNAGATATTSPTVNARTPRVGTPTVKQ